MRTKLAAALAALISVFALVAGAAPAQASTGGTADGEHAGVAWIVSYIQGPQGTQRSRCSAVLVSPTVLLTAGHCTYGVVGKTYVSFERDISGGPTTGLPTASDPAAGYTADDKPIHDYITEDSAERTLGTAQTHPGYSQFTDTDNWNDLGVIVLDSPVTQPTYPLAGLGTLDALRPGDVPKTIVRAVGYGDVMGKPDSGPQTPTPIAFPMERRYVDMPLQGKIEHQIVQANGNDNDARGTGGICFGDSGGPVFLNGEVIGIVSFGSKNCRYTAGIQRVDIAEAQDWLARVTSAV
ncbi:S1 family peptidase [Sinomonas flava]|uniref:S1 family peptidase n=1 Tax=Sinomonas flava TaxID=496857 RepID=UPI0039A5C0D3